MQQSIEFHGRLSRSDRRPANPGQYDLLFQVYPRPASQRVLWSETIAQIEVRSGGFFDVVLGQVSPISAALFSLTPRWLAIRVVRAGRPDPENAPRVPILGNDVQLRARQVALEERLVHLEDALIGEDVTGRSNRLRALPRRIQQLYTEQRRVQDRIATLEGAEEGVELARRLDVVAEGISRLSAPTGRLTRIEDELEDLIGPHGDVIDLNERMERLEKQILVGTGEGSELLAELISNFRDGLDELEVRQDRLERTIQNQKPADPDNVLGVMFLSAEAITPGMVVSGVGDGVVPSRHLSDPRVLGVALEVDGEEIRVALGGVVSCQVLGPVAVGDLLVASDQPGIATVDEKSPTIAATVARALESLEDPTGVIRILLI